MRGFWLGLVAVVVVCTPLLFHDTQLSPAGETIVAACRTALAPPVADPTDPLVVMCRSLAEPQSDDPYDTAMLLLIAIACALVALGMLVGTYDWGARHVGVFWLCVGISILFWRALATRWGWIEIPSTTAPPSVELITDVARASLIVGGLPLVWSSLDWAFQRWRPRRPHPPTAEVVEMTRSADAAERTADATEQIAAKWEDA
jgi:hypothetical protein